MLNLKRLILVAGLVGLNSISFGKDNKKNNPQGNHKKVAQSSLTTTPSTPSGGDIGVGADADADADADGSRSPAEIGTITGTGFGSGSGSGSGSGTGSGF